MDDVYWQSLKTEKVPENLQIVVTYGKYPTKKAPKFTILYVKPTNLYLFSNLSEREKVREGERKQERESKREKVREKAREKARERKQESEREKVRERGKKLYYFFEQSRYEVYLHTHTHLIENMKFIGDGFFLIGFEEYINGPLHTWVTVYEA
jgi:hypothetical protein